MQVACDEMGKQGYITHLADIMMFLKNYEWMSNAYVADFFTKDLWSKLPIPWQDCLNCISLDEIARCILTSQGPKTYRSVWPLSLLAYLATCHGFSLSKNELSVADFVRSESMLSSFKPADFDEIEDCKLKKLFAKNIKEKKRHEIERLSVLIHSICQHVGATGIVDVGAGLGHLSRLLATKYGYDVIAIEMAAHQLSVAEGMDREVQYAFSKICQESRVGSIRHVAMQIQPDIDEEEFTKLLSCYGNNLINISDQKVVLVGLHTCGELASTLLKVFKKAQSIVAVVSVSCCYMKMNLKCSNCFYASKDYEKPLAHDVTFNIQELNSSLNFPNACQHNADLMDHPLPRLSDDISSSGIASKENNTYPGDCCQPCDNSGFPLSRYLTRLASRPFSSKTLELACHFIEDYRLAVIDSSSKLKLRCYRAVFEVVMEDNFPLLGLSSLREDRKIWRVRRAEKLTFVDYAGLILKRLGVSCSPDLLSSDRYQQMLLKWKNVACFHSLVMLLGPAVEAAIMLDKFMFLAETGFKVSLKAVFDSTISPRNIALIAKK